jgi:MFS family permease
MSDHDHKRDDVEVEAKSDLTNEEDDAHQKRTRRMASYSPESTRRLVRKQDIHIMLLSIWIYLLCYLDRSNIGNAKVLNKGTQDDLLSVLHITNYEYTIGLMVFFVAYIIFETPSNWCIKKFGPRRWIAVLCAVWGMLTMCMGAIQNFAGLAVVRFVSGSLSVSPHSSSCCSTEYSRSYKTKPSQLLGAAEAGLFPGLVTLLVRCSSFPSSHRSLY